MRRQTMAGPSVLLAESRVLFRTGLRGVIDDTPDIRVLGEAGTYLELLDQVRAHEPDVVVVGHLADRTEPLPAAGRRPGAARYLMLVDPQKKAAYSATEIFADGIFLTDTGPDDFCGAIRILAAGYTLRAAPSHTDQTGPENPVPADAITNRESEVLQLLAEGRTNSEIARMLFLAESTVKSHVQSLLRKLKLHSRAGAVTYAYQHGLIHAGGPSARQYGADPALPGDPFADELETAVRRPALH